MLDPSPVIHDRLQQLVIQERTMLSALYGVMAMIPITFGIAGYALVSRD
jgi:hypothetical protein